MLNNVEQLFNQHCKSFTLNPLYICSKLLSKKWFKASIKHN